MSDPLTAVLATFRNPEATDWGNAWVGMEPTFQTRKSVRKWHEMSATPAGEDAYFEDRYMLKVQRKVAKAIQQRYEARRADKHACCPFERVSLERDLDQWHVTRQNLLFQWDRDQFEPFVVRLSLDPETFEYSIKPVPLVWFYDERFVEFLQAFLWQVPIDLNMSFAIAHGGGQFSFSAKTYLTGSLLADDIAYRTSHPELANWIMDWPNPDDRSFRATTRRREAFERLLTYYWEGRFHPEANGRLTVENAYLDRGFGPAHVAHPSLMDPHTGPQGTPRDVFQTNFAFGRSIRLLAQNIDPGYWQSANPTSEGYRPDQIMRYSEGNLNRLQIAGELHVKSGKVLDSERAPEFDAPLDISQLTTEASWENRAQMSRTSARDYVEALLLNAHHAQYLQAHPHHLIAPTLAQDQLLGDAERTLQRFAPAQLDHLHREARRQNLEDSGGRIHTDRVEPETLFWAAWHALPKGEKAAIAREVVGNFVERVEQAASVDPRAAFQKDPMFWHRHRVHPLLWKALATDQRGDNDVVGKELAAWQAHRHEYLARRPKWSQLKTSPPPWSKPKRPAK